MAQQNQPNQSFDPATVPVKRKRGRPRKEDVPGAELSARTQRRRQNPPVNTAGHDLVGQPVSGTLDGVFDAGFLITVRVCNNGPLLKGMVFDSRISVPVTAANDVAPHIKMSKREAIPMPVPVSAEPVQSVPVVSPHIVNKGLFNNGGQGSTLRPIVSEAVTPGTNLTVSNVPVPVTIQLPDNLRQGLIGELKVELTSKASQHNPTTGEMKVGSTSRTFPVNAAGERKLDGASQETPNNRTAGEPKQDHVNQKASSDENARGMKLSCQAFPSVQNVSEPMFGSTSQKTPGCETAGEMKQGSACGKISVNESASELKLDCASQKKTPGNETAGEPKLDGGTQKPLGNEIASEPMQKFACQPLIDETACELLPDSTSLTPVTVTVTGEPVIQTKLGLTSQAVPINVSTGDLKLDSPGQKILGNETAGKPKLGGGNQNLWGNETAAELIRTSASLTLGIDENASDLKLGSASQKIPDSETTGNLKLSSAGQETMVNETVGMPKLESLNKMLPEPQGPSPATVPDFNKVEAQNYSEQV